MSTFWQETLLFDAFIFADSYNPGTDNIFNIKGL